MAKEFLIDTADPANIFREDDAEEGTKKLLYIEPAGFVDGDFMSPDPDAGTLEIYYTGSEELKELLMYEAPPE